MHIPVYSYSMHSKRRQLVSYKSDRRLNHYEYRNVVWHSALNNHSSFDPNFHFGKKNDLGGWNFTGKLSIYDKETIEIVHMSLISCDHKLCNSYSDTERRSIQVNSYSDGD